MMPSQISGQGRAKRRAKRGHGKKECIKECKGGRPPKGGQFESYGDTPYIPNLLQKFLKFGVLINQYFTLTTKYAKFSNFDQ